MYKPIVSIIMGTLNSETRIVEAIQSIQNQSFSDWEFIICDDGSSDNTYNILIKLAEIDSRIVVLRNSTNQGLAKSLNRCIDIAKGEFIARMDDDDYSYKDRIYKQVNFLINNQDYDIVSSAIDIYDGKIITHKQSVKTNYPQKSDFMWGSCFVHPATMFRAEKLKSVNGYRISKETRRAEDYDLFMRMYSEGMKGYNFSESLLRYYVNPIVIKKRKFIYRIDEVIVRYKGFKKLKLFPKAIPYVLKPILVGLIPKRLILNIQSKIYT